MGPGPTVIFDIDGVLSDATGRQHFLEADPAGKKDWRGFFDACGDDPLLPDVAALVEVIDRDVVVVLLTGRPVRVQPQTLAWLEQNRLRWDLLVMRNAGNYTNSPEFKRLTVKELRERGSDIKVAFEDDLRNIEMFKAEGVPCVYIHSGYYD
jgi:phosphoglycolate phosphatase-like HAD superfamily hydrolase